MGALRSPLMRSIEDPARGVVAVGRPEPAARLVQMPIDGVLGETQLAGDLLGAHMAVDESKTLPLTLGEAVEAIDLVRKGGVTLVHREGNFRRTFRFGKPPEH
jgi:hypothetical protein